MMENEPTFNANASVMGFSHIVQLFWPRVQWKVAANVTTSISEEPVYYKLVYITKKDEVKGCLVRTKEDVIPFISSLEAIEINNAYGKLWGTSRKWLVLMFQMAEILMFQIASTDIVVPCASVWIRECDYCSCKGLDVGSNFKCHGSFV
ncbi:hypothetical protein LguiA_021053 [Lonicera macranthoides]